MKDNPHKNHRERVRDRFHTNKLENFPPHNALELLLFYGLARKDVNGLAHTLIEKFGSFSGVLDAHYDELLKVKGVGKVTATFIKMVPELARYYLTDKSSTGVVLSTTEELTAYLKNLFIGCTVERVYLLCLDQKYKLLNCVLLGEGSLDTVVINTRSVVEAAIRSGAYSVVLSHNHPQGWAVPSKADIHVTERLAFAFKQLDIYFWDHIIISTTSDISLRGSYGFIDF